MSQVDGRIYDLLPSTKLIKRCADPDADERALRRLAGNELRPILKRPARRKEKDDFIERCRTRLRLFGLDRSLQILESEPRLPRR